jgi:hypothetical protein
MSKKSDYQIGKTVMINDKNKTVIVEIVGYDKVNMIFKGKANKRKKLIEFKQAQIIIVFSGYAQ